MRMQEDHGDQGSPKMKELEGQLALVKAKLESARIVNKEHEHTYNELNEQCSELESLLKPGDEMQEKKKTLKDNENNLTSRLKALTGRISNLRHEVDALRAEKDKEEEEEEEPTRNAANAQVKGLKDQLDQTQQELATLRKQKSKLQDQLRAKTDEGTLFQIQLRRLKDELQTEKDSFLQKSEDMKQETQDLHARIRSLEENRNNGTGCLGDEKERLHTRISELEEMLSERSNELRTFPNTQKDEENESSTLRQEVQSLKDELDSLQSEKKRLERENEKLQLDHEQSRMEAENEVQKLKARIEDQRKALKEHQNSITKLEQSKPVRFYSLDSSRTKVDTPTISQQLLERKVRELADKFNMNMENNIRLLSQRIRVAEQTHIDNKDSYKKIKEHFEQQSKELNEKATAFEAEAREMRDTLMEVGSSMLAGPDVLVKKSGESNDNCFQRLSTMTDEVRVMKIGITNKIKELQHDVKALQAELDGKNEKELMLQEEVRELSKKLSNGEPVAIDKRAANLEEQLRLKESLFLELGEEKREAIRQLCVLIDDYRTRYDHLKGAMVEMSARNNRLS